MVANAWDAGATHVRIDIGIDSIVIEDDGRGLSAQEINERYLRVGYQKRRSESTVPVGRNNRHVMGRKGIGKLAAFSIANIVEVHTVKADVKNGFVMNLADIEKGIDEGAVQYNPDPVDPSRIDLRSGTRTILRDIKQPLLGVEDEVRTELARRFSIINSNNDFDVIVNGVTISLKDRNYYDEIQFMWYLGEESRKYVDRCSTIQKDMAINNVVGSSNGYMVSGWIATVRKPKDIATEHHVISIFAHGKLIQEDILSDIQEAGAFKQYLIGEIDADFMDDDDEADIVTSDRQRINRNDPRYDALRAFIAKEVRKIGNQWTRLRKESKEKDQSPKSSDDPPPEPNSPEPPGGTNSNNATPRPIDPPPQPPLSGAGIDSDSGSDGDANGNQNPPSGNGTDSNVSSGHSRSRQPPAREAQAIFGGIQAAVEASPLESEFKHAILYDLEQAKFAYYAQVHKASVVMLGAVVEGLMLGTLRRPEVIEHILGDPNAPGLLHRKLGGLRNPAYNDRSAFARALADNLSFDEYRCVIEHYIPHVQHLGIYDIQMFRNAVHPWRCITDPGLYGTYTATRALTHLTALAILADSLLSWVP
jgi:hypothetical protein